MTHIGGGFMRKHKIVIFLWVLGLTATTANAVQNGNPQTSVSGSGQGISSGGQQPGSGRRPPPPEAIAACQGKANGATCRFTDREGVPLSGSCFMPPAGNGVPHGQSNGQSSPGNTGLPVRPSSSNTQPVASSAVHSPSGPEHGQPVIACRPNRGDQGAPAARPDRAADQE